jgi:hypothetical protein
MFPTGTPGVGLFILRVTTGALMLVVRFAPQEPTIATWELAGFGVLALLLCLGLFTLVSCILTVLLEILSLHSLDTEATLHSVFVILIAVSLWTLGPGAYSIDAKIFGRRVISISTD